MKNKRTTYAFQGLALLLCLALLIAAISLAPAQAAAPEAPFPEKLVDALGQQKLAIGDASLNMTGLRGLYTLTNNEPIWKTDTADGRKGALALVESLKTYATYHGLRTEAFPFEILLALVTQEKLEDAKVIKTELLLSDTLLRVARRMRGEDITLSLLYPGWTFKPARQDVLTGLVSAIQQNKLTDYFFAIAPTDPTYHRLAEELKRYRELAAQGGWAAVPAGPTLKPGMTDARIVAVRDRLKAEGYDVPQEENASLYSSALQAVVIQYQERNGLDADGNIGAKSIAAMNISAEKRIDQIIATMERMRHMTYETEGRRIRVNIAASRIEILDDGQRIYEAPVVLGRPDRRTPFINSEIRSIVFNPPWNIPDSIVRKDILPKLRKDPQYLQKMGYAIKENEDDPYGTTVDWSDVENAVSTLRLRQPPGEMNALGPIKFDFDNDFAVYLHGTPKKKLFDQAERHLSSGCVRLKEPELFATFVTSPKDGSWDIDAVKEKIAQRGTRTLRLADPVPLAIVYDTAYFRAPDAPLSFARDIYGYDRLLIDVLNASNKR